MIVLFNVKITDIRIGYAYTRGAWMPNPERFDIFKYCLASTAVLEPLVEKFVLFITLAPELAHRQAELEKYIRELIPADKLILSWARLDFRRDWVNACTRNLTTAKLFQDPNQLVWLACNDDHIFVDNNLNVVESAITTLNADPDPNAIMYYSHWPEQMRMSQHFKGELTADGNFVKYYWENFDGIMILKAGRLLKYWDRDYGDALMFKTDYLGGHHGYKCPGNVYAPTRELVRHYEGYSHVGTGCDNIAPPLYIPPGFFEKNMWVRVGYPNRQNGWTNLNPASEWLYNFNPAGTDYRWTVKDIPLFWQGRISATDVAKDYDPKVMNQARDAAFLAATRVPMKCFGIEFTHENHHPKEFFKNHLLA
jgi:hypothetical protein